MLEALGLDGRLGEKTRVFVLAPITIVACLPIYFLVEQKLLKVKLRFSSEKEVLDLNTGKMVSSETGKPVDEAASNPDDTAAESKK
jgi:hypothetical protein